MTSQTIPISEDYSEFYSTILHTGSRVICDPPPDDTDDDYLLLVPQDKVVPFSIQLLMDGWVVGGSLPTYDIPLPAGAEPINNYSLRTTHVMKDDGTLDRQSVFHSWKRGEVNLVLTCNEDYFDDFHRATALARSLNLTNKADRVKLFEALSWDSWPSMNEEREKKGYDGIVYKKVYGKKLSPLKISLTGKTYDGVSVSSPAVWDQDKYAWVDTI